MNTVTVNSGWFYSIAVSPVKSDLAQGMLSANY
jgi:hypothetical protein